MSGEKAALVRPGLREQSSQPGGNHEASLPARGAVPAQGRKEGRKQRKEGSARPLPALCRGAPDRAPPGAGNGGSTRGGRCSPGAAAPLLPQRPELPPAGSGTAAELGDGLPRWLPHGKAPSPCGRSGSRPEAPRPGPPAAVPVSPVPFAGAAAAMAGAGPRKRRSRPGPGPLFPAPALGEEGHWTCLRLR